MPRDMVKDAFAILIAACHPRLKLLGVSTVHGNASLAHTTANAGSILTAIGAPHIPYYAGAAEPLYRSPVHAPDIHGVTGLDGTDLLPKAFIPPVKDGDAIVAMHEALMAEPAGQSWLAATGALTNISLLFTAFPELAEHIKGLSIMGGAIGDGFTNAQLGHVQGEGQRFGNHTPWAEFNIYCDPEAAQSIFSNPILAPKTTLVTLDLSHQVLANTATQSSILHGPPNGSPKDDLAIRQLFHDLLVFFANTYRDVFGISEGPPLHDPLAVAVVLADIGAEELAFDDRGSGRWGVTVVTDGLHSELDEIRGIRIPRGLDIAAFWETVEQCLQRAESSLMKRPVRSSYRSDDSS
ncbi:MAG: hypothetical protein Q9181_001740 [Wetmoreana brouardii]